MYAFLICLCVAFASSYPLENHPLLSYYYDGGDNPSSPPLPDSVTPLEYALKINPDLDRSSFKGVAEIRIFVEKSTKEVQLFARSLNLHVAKIEKQGAAIKDAFKPTVGPGDLFTITIDNPLEEKSEYVITIEFNGMLNDNMRGFYKSSYTVDGIQKRLAITNLQPNQAREAFPCFDELRFKTPFTISIAKNNDQIKTASNMPFVRAIDSRPTDGKIWDEYQKSQPMPTYSVAFMISEFYKTDSKEKVNVWARENAQKYVDYALKQGQKLLTGVESLTGVPYRLPKLDLVAVPDSGSEATANWGMITFNERNLLLDEASSSLQHKSVVTRTICNAVTRQWFGNSITPTAWNYRGLNGGLAVYHEYLATAALETTWNMDEFFELQVIMSALWTDATETQTPTAGVTCNKKAASIMKMLEHIITPNSFKKFVQTYLVEMQTKYSGNVNSERFFEILETHVKQDSVVIPSSTTITEIIKKYWIDNTRYPLVTVSRDSATKKVKITQAAYESPKPQTPSAQSSNPKWFVPLTYTTKSTPVFTETKPSLWLTPGAEVELPKLVEEKEWVLLNLRHSGYYRVNYDSENWNLLIGQLKDNLPLIPPITRAQLLDDSFALAKDNYISYEIPLKLADAMKKDTDFIPWMPVFAHLHRLYRDYADTSYQSDIHVFIRDLISDKILAQKEPDTLLTKIARTEMFTLLCKLDSPTCIQYAKAEYEKHSKDLSKINPDEKPAIYCGILRSDTNPKKEWENLWSLYEKTDISYDKNVILTAFGCTKSETLLIKTLKKLNDGSIRKQDRKYLIDALSYSSTSVSAALKYLKQQISASAYHLDDDSSAIMHSILHSVRPSLQTKEHKKLLEKIDAQLKETVEDDSSFSDFQKSVSEILKIATNIIEENEQKAYELAKSAANVLGKSPPKPPKQSGEVSASVGLVPSYLLVLSASFILYFKS